MTDVAAVPDGKGSPDGVAALDVLTVQEFAALLRISESTALRVCDAAPSMRILTTRRVSGVFARAALEAMHRGPVDLIEFAHSWPRKAVA